MINEFPLANSYYICDYQINELYSLFLKNGLGQQKWWLNYILEWKFLMDFFDILKDTFAKGESGQDVTVNELVEEIKEKLSGIIEELDSI